MTFHASADAGSNDKDFDPAPRPQRSNGPTRPTAARQQAAPCPSCVPCTRCQVGGVNLVKLSFLDTLYMSLSLFLSLSFLSCVPRSQCHVGVEINSNYSNYIYFNKSVLNERFFLVYAIHYQYPSLSNFICSLYLRTEERILVPTMRRKIMMKSPPQEEALTMSLTMRRTRMMRLIT